MTTMSGVGSLVNIFKTNSMQYAYVFIHMNHDI